MTRDEAIEIEKKKLARYRPFDSSIDNLAVEKVASANIDALIELGLLKVDEPIKPKRFVYIVSSYYASSDSERIVFTYEYLTDAENFVNKAKMADRLSLYKISEMELN